MVWGAVIGAVGGIASARMSSKAAGNAAAAASEAEMERLEFDKQRYQEWKDTYGGFEKNMAAYYDTLTPEFRMVQGLEAHEKEKDRMLEDVRANLARRGLSDSGLRTAIETDIAIASSEERARIRANAPMETAREKLAFLQVGLGQDPGSAVSQGLAGRANRLGNASLAASRAAGGAWRDAIDAGANLAEELSGVFAPSRPTSGPQYSYSDTPGGMYS